MIIAALRLPGNGAGVEAACVALVPLFRKAAFVVTEAFRVGYAEILLAGDACAICTAHAESAGESMSCVPLLQAWLQGHKCSGTAKILTRNVRPAVTAIAVTRIPAAHGAA